MLEVQNHCHARTVEQRLHRLPADLEPDRAFETSVGKVHVAEFFLCHSAFHQELDPYVLELLTAKGLAKICEGKTAVQVVGTRI